MLEGFRYVAGHRRVRTLMLLFAVVGVFGWSYSVLLPAYATDILHVGESGYGVLLSANGCGALLGALTVATWGSRVRPRLLILGGLWLFSAMLVALAVVRWYPLALVCLAVGGWGMLLYFSTTNTLIQRSVSNAMRGRVMGIWALVFGGMMPFGRARIRIPVARRWSAVDHHGGSLDLRRSRSVDLVGGASESHNSPRAGMNSGRADLVLLARGLLREPYWPRLAVRALGHRHAVAGPVQYGRTG